ncbi:MAG: hypothetical protein LBK95_18965 [Bifidobacteriaceae bacterium]|jgi:hypothetical protein|nr:hypothetical protein [Bifidobacteriaceae bacterium]
MSQAYPPYPPYTPPAAKPKKYRRIKVGIALMAVGLASILAGIVVVLVTMNSRSAHHVESFRAGAIPVGTGDPASSIPDQYWESIYSEPGTKHEIWASRTVTSCYATDGEGADINTDLQPGDLREYEGEHGTEYLRYTIKARDGLRLYCGDPDGAGLSLVEVVGPLKSGAEQPGQMMGYLLPSSLGLNMAIIGLILTLNGIRARRRARTVAATGTAGPGAGGIPAVGAEPAPPGAYGQAHQYPAPPGEVADTSPLAATAPPIPPGDYPQPYPYTYAYPPSVQPGAQPTLDQLQHPFSGQLKGLKVWAIINCCVMPEYVVPFFALSQVSKARRATSPEEFHRHRRLALILNWVCTGFLSLIFVSGIVLAIVYGA